MSKDYYKILGITEFETAENIKSAYRRLARKWHPDVAGNTEDVILKFKDINEAYEILSDSVKRAEYDRARRFYEYAHNTSYNSVHKNSEPKSNQTEPNAKTNYTQRQSKSEKMGFSFNWEDFISRKQRENSFKKEEKVAPKRGEDVYTDIEINIYESIEGVEKVINMLQTGVCPKCGGRKFVNKTVCPKCHGKGEIADYKKFTVKIPAGIKDKSKIRLAGEGGNGINGGANGDLYITIHIKQNNDYKIDGLNILKTVPITPYEAVLGANIKISTISGDYYVKIAPNTQNGQKIRLTGCGIVQNNKNGDMIITVEIRIPKNLTNEELVLYRKLAEISSSNIRDNIYDR